MPKCSFNKIALNFIEIALRHGYSPVNLLYIFRISFPKNTPGRLLLKESESHNLQLNKKTRKFCSIHVSVGLSFTFSKIISKSFKILVFFCKTTPIIFTFNMVPYLGHYFQIKIALAFALKIAD